MQRCMDVCRGAWMYAEVCKGAQKCKEVCGGGLRYTEVQGGVHRGMQRCMEINIGVIPIMGG